MICMKKKTKLIATQIIKIYESFFLIILKANEKKERMTYFALIIM